jgi:hypothetical protein
MTTMTTMNDHEFMMFENDDGSSTCVSRQAVLAIIDRHKHLMPQRGNYRVKDWMIREMQAYDRANNIVPPPFASMMRWTPWTRQLGRRKQPPRRRARGTYHHATE